MVLNKSVPPPIAVMTPLLRLFGSMSNSGGRWHPAQPAPPWLTGRRKSCFPLFSLALKLGKGWGSGTTVTLTLDGHPVVPKAPATDKQGAFNYTLNQGQEMFPTGLPAGRHTVQATGTGGQKAVTSFDVG